jgi:hypothetical protein
MAVQACAVFLLGSAHCTECSRRSSTSLINSFSFQLRSMECLTSTFPCTLTGEHQAVLSQEAMVVVVVVAAAATEEWGAVGAVVTVVETSASETTMLTTAIPIAPATSIHLPQKQMTKVFLAPESEHTSESCPQCPTVIQHDGKPLPVFTK